MIAFPFKFRLILLFLSMSALATLSAGSSEATNSGLPLPRFVTLADVQVNARAGPGFRFPINWVYVRKGLPVEVIDEFGHWRRTRDVDGDAGTARHEEQMAAISHHRMACAVQPWRGGSA